MEKKSKEIFKGRERLNLGEEKKVLNEKEIANLLFESFKFSQGNLELQLMYLLEAYNYFGPQEFDPKNVRELFLKYLGKVEFAKSADSVKTGLSEKKIHIKMSGSNFEEMTKVEHGTSYSPAGLKDFMEVLKSGRAVFMRQERDLLVVSVKQEDLTIRKFINHIVNLDFRYLVLPKYETDKLGRPNREDDAVGNNTLRDRYYSFFVWNLLLGHSSNFSFSDKIFSALRAGFLNYFNNLEPHKPFSYKFVLFGGGLKTKQYQGGFEDKNVTKDNIIELITQYNSHHPETMFTEKMLRDLGCKF